MIFDEEFDSGRSFPRFSGIIIIIIIINIIAFQRASTSSASSSPAFQRHHHHHHRHHHQQQHHHRQHHHRRVSVIIIIIIIVFVPDNLKSHGVVAPASPRRVVAAEKPSRIAVAHILAEDRNDDLSDLLVKLFE
jgi:Ni/Co efflux regulator RcnB